MKVLKILLILILLPLLYVAVNIVYGTLTDYNPPDEEAVVPANTGSMELTSDSLNLYIWNIGYAGLGKESDFFLDGGKMTRSGKALTEKNYNGIRQEIGRWGDADFILLQEVDEDAKRSYGTDQFRGIGEELGSGFTSAIGHNFVVNFIPVPYLKPLGRVKAGLATYTPYVPTSVKRYQFPGSFSWPKRIYFLDRCFMVMRFPFRDRELLVINTHNSAYDDGTLKAEEMAYLKKYVTTEYEQGNYVIVGGDWNQCPPGYDCYGGFSADSIDYNQSSIDAAFMPEGWTWAYDDSVRTNRKLEAPYRPGETFTTVIDYYLVSPNVTVLETRGIDLGFEYSDHQPVRLSVRLE